MYKLKFTSLFSSSKGNSLLFESEDTNILIDAGLPAKSIENELKKAGKTLSDIDAVLITHEHTDHIKGAGVISRRYDTPLFMTKGSAGMVKRRVGPIDEENINYVYDNIPFNIKNIEITPFDIPHDSVEPVGYIINAGKVKIGIATDMGMIMEDVVKKLGECKVVFLESNHDIDMLKNGRYPIDLKKRILSPLGHLSNEASGNIISKIVQNKTEIISLGHLSEENNLPSIALKTVKEITKSFNIKEGRDYKLNMADRIGISSVINF